MESVTSDSGLDLSRLFLEDLPPVAESDVSSENDASSVASIPTSILSEAESVQSSSCASCVEVVPGLSTPNFSSALATVREPRPPLQWNFYGLTLWLELEEFDMDLTRAINHAAEAHGTLPIPKSHTTAIYGMEHLTIDEAKARLHAIRDVIPAWPTFAKPVGVVQDISEAGKPGQVCTIAWSELTLMTSPEHEKCIDLLYDIFYGPGHERARPWKPHNSIAYDNPENSALSLLETVAYVAKHPTLLGKERRVEAISLWDTNGKMEDWKCIDRVRFG